MVTSLAMQLGVSSLCGGREKGEGQDGGGGGGGGMTCKSAFLPSPFSSRFACACDSPPLLGHSLSRVRHTGSRV